MKISSGLLAFTIVTINIFSGCGPSEDELEQQELALQDSLEQVYQEEVEEMRRDSLARTNQNNVEPQNENPVSRTSSFEYSENGTYTVQIEAWRSESKAYNQAEMWKQRDFDRAFVIKYGNPEAGDVWYRVRLGKFETFEMAQNFKSMLEAEYNAESWVSKTDEYPGNAKVIN